MATIATAEVEIIADTRRFVTDLRRKLRAAFATLGNDIGKEMVDRIDRQVSRRLDTLMQRAGRNAGREFTKSWLNTMSKAGLTDSLRDQLAGPAGRRGAQRAGEQIAEAVNDGFRASNRTFSDSMMQALSNQTIFRAAGLAGQDTAQAFADNFRDQIRRDMQGRIADAIEDAASDIPPIFRNNGRSAAEAFTESFGDSIDDINQAIFDAFAGSEVDTDRFFTEAAERAGTAYSQGLIDSINQPLRTRLTQQMQQALDQAAATGIPPIFRRMGNNAGVAFTQGVADEVDDSLTATLGRLFLRFGTRNAQDAGNRAGSSFGRGFLRALRGLPGAFGRLLNTIAIQPLAALGGVFAQMTSEMLSMAGQALVVVALLEALSGLLFGLPAATNVAAAGIAAIIVPLLGTQDAFSEAFGEAENFEDALEGLTAPAQDVARELRAIAPALTDLRLQAQAAFFSEIDGAITEIANNLLGPLTTGLTSASGAFGRIVDQIGEFLAQSESADTVAATFERLTGIFDALAASTVPFLEGMRNLVDEFLPRIEDLEGPLASAGDRFREWTDEVIESGAAMEAFDRGLDTLEEIASIVRDISEIFDAMFDAAESVGVDALGAVADAVADIRAEFESIEGQELLGSVFDSLGRIADVVGSVFATLFENIAEIAPDIADLFEEVGPSIEELIDGLTEGFQELLDSGGIDAIKDLGEALADIDWGSLGTTIGELLADISPVLDEVADLINDLIGVADVVGEVIGFLIDLVDIIGQIGGSDNDLTDWIDDFFQLSEGVENLGKFFAEAAEGWANFFREVANSDFVQGILDWLNDDSISQAIDDFIAFLGDEIGEGLEGIGDVISETASGWGTFFSDAWTDIKEGFADGTQTALEAVTGWVEDVQEGFDDLIEGLGGTTTSFFTGLGETFTNGLDTASATITTWIDNTDLAWSTFLTGLGDAVLLGLDTIGLDFSTSLGGIDAEMTDFESGVREGWDDFLSGLGEATSNGLNNIRTFFTNAATSIREGWNNFWSGLGTLARNGLDRIRSTVSSVINSIRSAISGWISSVRGSWNSFFSGLGSTASSALSSVSSRVSNALSSLRTAFSNFSSSVRNIWSGLLDSIRNIASSISGIVDNIRSAVSSAISAASNLGNIDLNPFANGGIVNGPTAALIGEAGREVVIPLTRPQRAADLAQQSGLIDLLTAQGALGASTATASGPSVEMHVHSGVADPEQIARRAVRIIERHMGGRGLERTP